MKTLQLEYVRIGEDYIDQAVFLANPSTRAYKMIVERRYCALVEKHDLATDAGWVKLRRALQGGAIL